MKYRSKTNYKQAKKYFTKTAAKVNPRNARGTVRRGGYRL